MNDPNSNRSKEPLNDPSYQNVPPSQPGGDEADRGEILDSLLEQTQGQLSDQSLHQKFTDYVREHRLSSQFDFENVCELVRYVVTPFDFEKLGIDREECVSWIATCLYEDPVSNEKTHRLWDSILSRIQG